MGNRPFLSSQTDPAHTIVEVTQSDTADDPGGPFRGIVFGGAGILRILTQAGDDVTIPSGVLSAGVIHPIRVKRVFTSDTAATDIYGIT